MFLLNVLGINLCIFFCKYSGTKCTLYIQCNKFINFNDRPISSDGNKNKRPATTLPGTCRCRSGSIKQELSRPLSR